MIAKRGPGPYVRAMSSAKAFLAPAERAEFLAFLRRHAPTWAYGQEEPRTQAGFAGLFARLASSAPLFGAMRRAVALWAFLSRPLDTQAAALAREAETAAPFLSPAQLGLLSACERAFSGHVPDELRVVLHDPEPDLLVRLLVPLVAAKRGHAPACLAASWPTLLRLGSPELARDLVRACDFGPGADALRPRLMAEISFHYDPPETALAALSDLGGEWGPWAAQRRAECLAALGETAKAARLYAELWRDNPWHVNLALRLHTLRAPKPALPDPARDEAAVCLYSWNKCDLLRATLKSLAASRLGAARVLVLDNGSTDGTAEMLREMAPRFAEGCFGHVSLLVNVGAPAARNWLLTLPEAANARWAAFVDDDVILPPDWLARLLATARNAQARGFRPGAVGCRITEATAPFGLQSADYHLFLPPPREKGQEPLAERIGVFDNCAGQLDAGLFSYVRPCLSVSGCCHLISREAREASGGFDVRFTPTQFDDLERDMRSTLAGFPSLYDGGLAVRHVQHASLARAKTPAQVAHIAGNKVKLEGKYADDEVARLAKLDLEACWTHLEAVLADLDEGQTSGGGAA
ncbi:glycosyltransferase family 2 protein [Alkalidesulfovibrio alkalitolerans]|nr:glycosyltransferase [Alkalidesulfovibrio alkalitolerans]